MPAWLSTRRICLRLLSTELSRARCPPSGFRRAPMGYKAIYAYPWDLAEIGVSAAIDRFLALGLDTVTVAGSYHAGKFLRPHGKGGKVFFPEDGTVYFKPDLSRYGAIKPADNTLLASGQDMVGELAGKSRMATNVWLVLLHNTRLGSQHPDSVVANAFGDRYIYSLCPSAPGRARLRDWPRARRDAILCGQRRLARDAGLSALRARLPSRVRAQSAKSLARQPARPLLLRPLRGGSEERRDSGRSAEAPGGGRHRSLSRERHRFSRRHGGGLLARRREERRRPRGLSRLALRGRDLARPRNPRGGAKGCNGRGDSLGRAADRRRLV